MFGFTHIATLGVHFFLNQALAFCIKLLPDGSGAFTKTDVDYNGLVVAYPAPKENLLGAYYQPGFPKLGYDVAWYANCAHEMLHIFYCQATQNRLSPNHGMLLGLNSARVEECDREEKIITGLQIYCNTGRLTETTRLFLPNDARFIADLARDFHNWIGQRVARPVGAACLLAHCQTETKPKRV